MPHGSLVLDPARSELPPGVSHRHHQKGRAAAVLRNTLASHHPVLLLLAGWLAGALLRVAAYTHLLRASQVQPSYTALASPVRSAFARCGRTSCCCTPRTASASPRRWECTSTRVRRGVRSGWVGGRTSVFP
jgi:hypothetical protein